MSVKVTAVEIRKITPPPEIREAMTKQMAAERNRRAIVTEASGQRDAAIRVAEGNKRAAILAAEGAREASILRAEGFAIALERIFEIAQRVDSKTMSLQYLEALKTIGTGESTKVLLPVELTALLRPFIDHTAAASGAQD